MDRDAIRKTAAASLALVIGRAIGPAENPTRDGEPKWDSLKHVEIIFSVEDAFKVRFDDDELAELDSLDAIVACLEKHLHHHG
jgi:acyl carrier protein